MTEQTTFAATDLPQFVGSKWPFRQQPQASVPFPLHLASKYGDVQIFGTVPSRRLGQV